MLNAVAKHINYAAFGNLALQAMEKLLSPRTIFRETERFDYLGLSDLQKVQQLGQIHCMVKVIIISIARDVTGILDKRGDNQRFKSHLTSISRRHRCPPQSVPRCLPGRRLLSHYPTT